MRELIFRRDPTWTFASAKDSWQKKVKKAAEDVDHEESKTERKKLVFSIGNDFNHAKV